MNRMEMVVSCNANSIKKNKIVYGIEISISNIKHIYKSNIIEVVEKFISKYKIFGKLSSTGDNITYKFLSYHFGSWDADKLCNILHERIEMLDKLYSKNTIEYTLEYDIDSGVRINTSFSKLISSISDLEGLK